MTVEFYDRYSTNGFWFRDQSARRRFCLSATGAEDRDCAAGFAGSLAIARYRFQPRSPLRAAPAMRAAPALREHVRTIDQDSRLCDRPPFERAIELRQGVASDIQAFGYETEPGLRIPQTSNLWYYFRQDLYLAARVTPFLVVHWRHAFHAIRILDVIPGDGTWLVKK
jgi:hypothetical protein